MSNPNTKKEMLGKGIRSLLQGIDSEMKNPEGTLKTEVVEKTTGMFKVPIGQIEVNPRQPRQDFDEQALQELAASIRLHDIIQPLTVARIAPDKYRLIAGERRLRASKIAGLKEVPVFIREANDQQLLEMALLENLQRQDLNAIEIGLSYKRLMDECDLTQEQVAERMGKERSTVTNYIRLLKLPPAIVVAVRNGTISMGHARALINVDVVDKQLRLFKEIIDKGLSVRQAENLVRTLYNEKKAPAKTEKTTLPPIFRKIEDTICSHFGTKAKLVHQKKGHGQIVLEYYSVEELNALLEKMKITVQ
ncbi:MAG: ParB/RepB/Spo0J family partition protein [Chitinophagaceae bacterium]|jgi:ParB family chromosome partitioning protein|nr:ParB/RepB/Spo0J family partition protein [Chitinophagaceae bacterium]